MPASPDLSQARQLARSCGLIEVYFNEASRVVSFQPLQDESVRINYYYTTGTVGTCLTHPRQGPTQLFRRNATIAAQQSIFREPRVHTDRGYQRKRNMPSGELSEPVGEEAALSEQLSRLDKEAANIAEERQQVQAALNSLEAARRAAALQEQSRRQHEKAARQAIVLEKQLNERGRNVEFTAFNREEVDRLDCQSAVCIAMSGQSIVVLYADGRTAWSAGLTVNLDKKLRTRALSHGKPTYFAAGSQGRYYISFDNGKSEWVAPDALGKLIQDWGGVSPGVKLIAFGDSWDSYYVLFNDSSSQWAGLPTRLQNKLGSRNQQLAGVKYLSLGPNEEWFVSFEDGSWELGGAPANLSDSIDCWKKSCCIQSVLFGDDQSWLYRYS
jgi:hypothetical protein